MEYAFSTPGGRVFWQVAGSANRVIPMPTYISLLEFTQDGIENIEESPARLDQARDLAAEMQCDVEEFYLTFGRYDAVAVIDAPDDDTAAEFVLSVAKQGAIGSETLKAFPEDEYRDIIDALP